MKYRVRKKPLQELRETLYLLKHSKQYYLDYRGRLRLNTKKINNEIQG